MSFEEKRKAMQEKDKLKKENRLKVSKQFDFKNSAEESNINIIQEYNGISIEIKRKGYNQTRGKEVSYSLNKQEVEELKEYLEKALNNWDEWNILEK